MSDETRSFPFKSPPEDPELSLLGATGEQSSFKLYFKQVTGIGIYYDKHSKSPRDIPIIFNFNLEVV
jgi:hypothetical protein